MSKRGNAVLQAWEERIIAEKEAVEVTTRCAWCGWSAFGVLGTVREAHTAHRVAEHPDRQPRARRKRYRPAGQISMGKNLDDNIAGARAQGGAAWETPR